MFSNVVHTLLDCLKGCKKVAMTTSSGSSVMLPCVAFGVPAPNIEWYKSNKHVSEDPGAERVTIFSNGTLEIRDVTVQDADVYTCRAYNLLGSATVKHTLIVQCE